MEKTGTKVTFKPDGTIFQETTVYDYDILKTRLREMAFLTKGLRIILEDDRIPEDFVYENGEEQTCPNDPEKTTVSGDRAPCYIYDGTTNVKDVTTGNTRRN
jgi:DNA gyrase/topoisomerase IV subunit B